VSPDSNEMEIKHFTQMMTPNAKTSHFFTFDNSNISLDKSLKSNRNSPNPSPIDIKVLGVNECEKSIELKGVSKIKPFKSKCLK